MTASVLVPCLLALACIATANPIGGLQYAPHAPILSLEKISNPSYGFNYAVNDPVTGDNKAQWESRHGDLVQGAYTLVEPDGNIRLVEYNADPIRGFNAVVKRTGPSIHPVAPVLHKPLPPLLPIVPIKPLIAPLKPIAPLLPPPIISPIAPLLPPPIISHTIPHLPILDPLPLLPLPLPSWNPWVHLSKTTYGPKGNIIKRWTTGPISLAHGQRVIIKTRH